MLAVGQFLSISVQQKNDIPRVRLKTFIVVKLNRSTTLIAFTRIHTTRATLALNIYPP